MASTRFSQLSLDDVIKSSRGSKFAKLRDGDGDFSHIPSTHLRVPFEPGTYDKAPDAWRLNILLECDDELKETVEEFDAQIIRYLAEHSERIFKRRLTIEQVKVGYSSCLKPGKESWPSSLKCKMDTEGRKTVACWAPDGSELPMPQTWRDVMVRPRLYFSHLWIMGSQFGVVVQLMDAELVPRDPCHAADQRSNPFK